MKVSGHPNLTVFLLGCWICRTVNSFSGLLKYRLQRSLAPSAGLGVHSIQWQNRFTSSLKVVSQDQKEDPSSSLPDNSSDINGEKLSKPSSSKLSTLKDRMWVREALEDLTAAEFACSLATSGSDEEESGKKKKNSVDFENILSKLEKRIEEMCVITQEKEKSPSCIASYPVDDKDGMCWALKKNQGMGSVTYTDDQRDALLT